MKLNKTLDSLIHKKRITQTKLAKETGVPVQTINNWLSGQSPQNLDQLKKVADYFGVTIDELCFGGDQINGSSLWWDQRSVKK